ncbi:hypothetical protein [Streptomyces sp. NPDC020362]|uniref:hypothetical protein n=1 Tax=unclassified Streptomyces TaxID=2593676 RepID=UPI000B079188
MVWDLQDDEWFCDCPVLFDFDGEQVEINHHKLDELSVTWNTIDPARPVRWPGFDLQWRSEPLPELQALRGLALKDTELLEWMGRDVAHGNVDVGFAFETGRVTVFNSLDENGLSFDAALPVGQQWMTSRPMQREVPQPSSHASDQRFPGPGQGASRGHRPTAQ